MALTPWVHENKFEAGTVIRAESANVKFDGIESKLAEIINQLNTRVVTLPEVFTGSPQIPEQTPENTYIYINGNGDIALYSIQDFVDDVASTATNAAQAKNFRDQAALRLTETEAAAQLAADHLAQTETYKTQAQQESAAADAHRIAAAASESNAAAHALAASQSETNASNFALTAKSWADQAEAIVTGGDVVPSTRLVNGKSLATNISLTFSDVGAKPANYVPQWNEIANKPSFSAAAFSGDYADLTNKPNLALVATTGDFNDLANKPTAFNIGAVPDTRTVNGRRLNANITISASDVGAKSANYVPTWGEIVGRPSFAAVAFSGLYGDITDAPTLSTVATSGSYRDLADKPTAATLGAVPTVRTINGKSLGTNIALNAADVGAKPSSYTPSWNEVTGKPATATRWANWSEVTSKPSTFPPSAHTHSIANVSGLQNALDGKLSTNMGINSDRNDSNQTITRTGKITMVSVWSTGNVTKTIDSSTFGENDIIVINKHLSDGEITITTDSGVIYIPNGSNSATQDIGTGITGQATLIKFGNDFFFVGG